MNKQNKIHQDSLYFDIGANVGKWCAKNYKRCEKIIAVEPSIANYKILSKNCHSKNIICLNYAVSNTDKKEIDFYENGCISTINKNWLCSKKSRFYGREYVKTTCQTIKLDKLIKQYGIPDLIKIDVEGAEDLAISSLSQKVKTLCFEWAQEFYSVTINSINHLMKIGFTKFYVQSNGKFSFVPKEEEYTEDLNIIKEKLTTNERNINHLGEIKQPWGMIWAK
jgi:FkbM family methyltransferase